MRLSGTVDPSWKLREEARGAATRRSRDTSDCIRLGARDRNRAAGMIPAPSAGGPPGHHPSLGTRHVGRRSGGRRPAVVAWWRIVGSGYVWLSGGVTLLFGIPAALSGAGAWAIAGIGAGGSGTSLVARDGGVPFLFDRRPGVRRRRPRSRAACVATITGAVLLGAITAEMMLGHWFLSIPASRRWSLRRLDLIAGSARSSISGCWPSSARSRGMSGDACRRRGVPGAGRRPRMVLIAAVWASLGEEGYPAVMAATGLVLPGGADRHRGRGARPPPGWRGGARLRHPYNPEES